MNFGQPGKTSTQRMSAEECKERILGVLKSARRPLKKSEIVKKAAISTSTWNLRIKELLAADKVKKQGAGRDTRYLPA
jgi:DNA-binding transcriptional regulator GbsR (MarR family)